MDVKRARLYVSAGLFLAWLTWLFIHLMYIVQFQSRVQVFIQWGFEYLTFSRGARIITGATIDDNATQASMVQPTPSSARTQSKVAS